MIKNSLENLILTLYLLSPQVEERRLPLGKVRKIDDEAVIFSEAVCLGKVTALPLSAFLHLFLQDLRLCGQENWHFHGQRVSPVCRARS